jgi:hypothetical protein
MAVAGKLGEEFCGSVEKSDRVAKRVVGKASG